MKFSSLKYSDFSWTAIAIYDRNGVAILASAGINILHITNMSGENRVYSVNQGAPFPVATGTSRAYDLAANLSKWHIVTVEYSVATLTAHYVDGV